MWVTKNNGMGLLKDLGILCERFKRKNSSILLTYVMLFV